MRFKRPSTAMAAIRCPSCRHIFEVESALLTEEPIIAEVVKEEPLAVVVIEEPQPYVAKPSLTGPTGPRPIVSDQQQPVVAEEPHIPLRPVLPHKQKTVKSAPKVSKPKQKQESKRLVWIAVVSAAFVLFSGSLFFLSKFIFGKSLPSKLEQFGIRYEETLESLRRSMASHITDPDEQNVNEQVLKLRSLLVDCVNSELQPEPQTNDLRTRLNSLSDAQVETRRWSNQIASSFDRKSLVDQVPTMIELITKQLNYGIRQSRPSRETSDQFCATVCGKYRKLDQALGRALLADQISLEEIGASVDELDQLIVDYSQSAKSRVELGYENKLALECGTAWRNWCLRQLQLSGQTQASQAVSKELDALKQRFDLAISAVAVDKQLLTAVGRLNKRVQDSAAATKSDLAQTGIPAVLGGSSVGTKTVLKDINGSPSGSSSTPAANSLTGNSNGPSDPSQNPAPTATSTSSQMPSVVNGSQDSATGSSSTSSQASFGSNSSTAEFGFNNASLGSSGPVAFPAPRFIGPNTLAIKFTTSKNVNEVRQIGTAIAQRIASVVDAQMQGNQVTLSFSNFSGQVHEAVKHVNFGKVEIADTQSRTLFVAEQ